jgi:hypothetical protein
MRQLLRSLFVGIFAPLTHTERPNKQTHASLCGTYPRVDRAWVDRVDRAWVDRVDRALGWTGWTEHSGGQSL